ncbi:MAG: tetratricopeptide repeat protein [Sphingomonas bacterium]|nr:ATP-binding protein [Sphingomonas bacterium]MDB5690514.1 tetratricopeptide repeat protein [Sphingomonas bacterium]
MHRLRLAAIVLLGVAMAGISAAGMSVSIGGARTRGTTAPAAPARSVAALEGGQARFDAEIGSAKSAMLADPEKGLSHAAAAVRIASAWAPSKPRTIAMATGQWLRAESLIRLNRPDQADRIVAAALRQIGAIAPGTLLHADLLQSDGRVSSLLGRVQQALQDFQQAHNIYRDLGEARSQAGALMSIGSIYNNASDYARVLQYYAQAAEVFGGDPSFDLSTHNNRGNALRELGRFREAEGEYRLALAAAQKLGSPLLTARILTNIAAAQELSGQLAQADASVARGLQIAQQPTAADWRPFLWGIKARIAYRHGDVGAAAAAIARTFDGVDLAHTPMPFREFHEFARTLYAQRGEDKLALAHFEAFKRLEDESRQLAASTNSALMAARFDFANQDLRIAKLKTGQLERDVLIARSRARLHTIVASGVVASALVILTLLLFGYIKIRRSRDAVKAANTSLSASNTALEKALKAKTEFLATTSHEIRTPLNGILGMTQVILHDPAITGPLRDRIQLVHGSGETMKVLVDDLLDVAKMETGQVVIDRADMDLRRLLGDVTQLWSGQAIGQGLRLELELGDAPARIVEDETRLRQILFNLLSNAIKFTEEGTVTVSVGIGTQDGGETMCLRVVDTGIGIPADHHERIFEAFHQVDGGTTRRYGGTGLGLAICRNLVTAMGGTIGVESAPGAGSTFLVTLPLVRVAPAAAVRTDGGGNSGPRTLAESHLLVIERNPLAQSILRATVETEVARLEIANSGEDALAMIAAQPFDAIVAEGASATLPGLDGIASVARLCAAVPGASVTILWSGLTEEIRGQLIASGAARVLGKPIAAKALLEALRAAAPAADRSAPPGEDVGGARKSAA